MSTLEPVAAQTKPERPTFAHFQQKIDGTVTATIESNMHCDYSTCDDSTGACCTHTVSCGCGCVAGWTGARCDIDEGTGVVSTKFSIKKSFVDGLNGDLGKALLVALQSKLVDNGDGQVSILLDIGGDYHWPVMKDSSSFAYKCPGAALQIGELQYQNLKNLPGHLAGTRAHKMVATSKHVTIKGDMNTDRPVLVPCYYSRGENGKTSNVFVVHSDGRLTLKHVELRNGYVVRTSVQIGDKTVWNRGGGIQNNGILTLDDVIFARNYAANGGAGAAIWNNGHLTATSSIFHNNYGNYLRQRTLVQKGGAVYNDAQGISSFLHCIFRDNYIAAGSSASAGGAIFNEGQLTLTNTSFYRNVAGTGAAVASSGTMTVLGGIFSGNVVEDSKFVRKNTCIPAAVGTIPDQGYPDAFRGWYDIRGCGVCFDWCGWVSDGGSGGNPSAKTTFVHPSTGSISYWKCYSMSGDSMAVSKDPQSNPSFSTFPYKKCGGMGLPSFKNEYSKSGGINSVITILEGGVADITSIEIGTNVRTRTQYVGCQEWVVGGLEMKTTCSSHSNAVATCVAQGQRLCSTTDLIGLNIMRTCYIKVWVADHPDKYCVRSIQNIGCGGVSSSPPAEWACGPVNTDSDFGALCCDDETSKLTADNLLASEAVAPMSWHLATGIAATSLASKVVVRDAKIKVATMEHTNLLSKRCEDNGACPKEATRCTNRESTLRPVLLDLSCGEYDACGGDGTTQVFTAPDVSLYFILKLIATRQNVHLIY